MKVVKSWLNYKFSPPLVIDEDDEMVQFEPFIVENLKTSNEFPKSDKLYYESLEAQLVHLLYKFEKGWITSKRQVMLHSDECISNVHFLIDSNNQVYGINVFQRSSNLFNLEDDIQFFNYFKHKHLSKYVDIKILLSMPHLFKFKNKKIED